MTRFKLEDGALVDTDKAQASWNEALDWNGKNHISRATGDQFLHETLYKSAKGRYYLVHSSQWQGSQDRAGEISPEEAAKWILLNDRDLPKDLAKLEEEIVE